MDREALEAIAELSSRQCSVLEAVAELAERGSLEEFGRPDPLLLRSIASRRRRIKGRFADEASLLAAPKSSSRATPPVDQEHALAARPQKQYSAGTKVPKATSDRKLNREIDVEKDPRRADPEQRRKPKRPNRAYTHDELEDTDPEELIGRGPWESGLVGRARQLMASEPRKLDSQRMFKPGGHINEKGEYEGGTYTAERMQLHRAIVSAFLHRIESHPEGEREVLFMAGGPASGKSTALKNGVAKAPDGSVLINPDAVKRLIPEYSFMLALKDPNAASRIHEESGDIAKAISAHARERGYHVTVDKVKIKPAEVATFVGDGYKADAVVVTVPIPLAKKRAKQRGDRTGRYVADEILIGGHQEVAGQFEDWAQKTGMPMTVFDSDTGRILAKAAGGTVGIVDDKGYKEFRARAFSIR